MSNESINAEEKQEPLSISSSAVPNASVRVHKLVYKHGSPSPEDRGHLQAPVSPREKCFFALHLNWITQIWHLK